MSTDAYRMTDKRNLAKALAQQHTGLALVKDALRMLVAEDPSKPGAYRGTLLLVNEPLGHVEYASLEDAIYAALLDGYRPDGGTMKGR